MDSQSELTSKIHEWRFTDLSKVESALDRAYLSVQGVKDVDTAEKFVDLFEDMQKLVRDLSVEINNFSGKAKNLKSEMKRQESASEK